MYRYVFAFLLVNAYSGYGLPTSSTTSKDDVIGPLSSFLSALTTKNCPRQVTEIIQSQIETCDVNVPPLNNRQFACLMFYDINKRLCTVRNLPEDFTFRIDKYISVEEVCYKAQRWLVSDLEELPTYKNGLEMAMKDKYACTLLCGGNDILNHNANFFCKYYQLGMELLYHTTAPTPIKGNSNSAYIGINSGKDDVAPEAGSSNNNRVAVGDQTGINKQDKTEDLHQSDVGHFELADQSGTGQQAGSNNQAQQTANVGQTQETESQRLAGKPGDDLPLAPADQESLAAAVANEMKHGQQTSNAAQENPVNDHQQTTNAGHGKLGKHPLTAVVGQDIAGVVSATAGPKKPAAGLQPANVDKEKTADLSANAGKGGPATGIQSPNVGKKVLTSSVHSINVGEEPGASLQSAEAEKESAVHQAHADQVEESSAGLLPNTGLEGPPGLAEANADKEKLGVGSGIPTAYKPETVAQSDTDNLETSLGQPQSDQGQGDAGSLYPDDDVEEPMEGENQETEEKIVTMSRGQYGSLATEDDHFFSFFMTAVIMVVLLYVLYHNKSKVSKVVLGLIVEGRQTGRRRNSRGHAYKRLDTLEQAMNSGSSAPPSKMIY